MGTGVGKLKAIGGVLILATFFLGGCSNPLLETVDELIDEYKAVLAGEQPEINVKWGAIDITDGDSENLGNVDQEWPVEFEFTIENTGAGTLHLTDSPQVALSGGIRYTVIAQPPATIAPGGSAEFTIELDPGNLSGNPSIVVTIENDDPDESSYEFTLSAAAGKYQGTKTLDSGNDVGQYSCIGVFDANVYTAYFDADDQDLKLAVSRNGGYDWSTKAVESSGAVGSHCALFVNEDDLYISYYDITNKNLKLARSSNGGESFNLVTVASSGDVGQHTSIDVTVGRDIYISYYDATNDELEIAIYDDSAGSWSYSPSADGGKYTSIAESGGNCFASFQYKTGASDEDNELYIRRILGGTPYVALNVSNSSGVGDGYCTSTEAVGSTVYISHFSITGFSMCGGEIVLEKSTNNGANWSSYTVDSAAALFWSPGNVGFTSLAVSGSNLFVSYCANDVVDGALKFAKSTSGGTSWSPQEVDISNDNVGYYTSIAVNGTGGSNVYISYYDKGNHRLKFARSANGGASWD